MITITWAGLAMAITATAGLVALGTRLVMLVSRIAKKVDNWDDAVALARNNQDQIRALTTQVASLASQVGTVVQYHQTRMSRLEDRMEDQINGGSR